MAVRIQTAIQHYMVLDEISYGIRLVTCASASLPVGFEWREIDGESGELHLFSPSGINITRIYWSVMDELNEQ